MSIFVIFVLAKHAEVRETVLHSLGRLGFNRWT
jgi:HEAT repeat